MTKGLQMADDLLSDAERIFIRLNGGRPINLTRLNLSPEHQRCFLNHVAAWDPHFRQRGAVVITARTEDLQS